MISSFRYNRISEFKEYYRSANLLVIDDFQYISEKDRSQVELLYTLRDLIDTGNKIVIASNYHPNRLLHLSSELNSLLHQGEIIELSHPDSKIIQSILDIEFKQANIELDEQIVSYFSKPLSYNLNVLKCAMRRVVNRAKYTNEKVTLDFVQNTLSNFEF